AAKLTSPRWFRSYVASKNPAVTNVPPPGMASPGRATAIVVPFEKRKTPSALPTSGTGVKSPIKTTSSRLFTTAPKARRKTPPPGGRVTLMSNRLNFACGSVLEVHALATGERRSNVYTLFAGDMAAEADIPAVVD